MPASDPTDAPALEPPWAEARRVLAICNLCGYCNGFCPTFAAAARRAALTRADLDHLAHLCHDCRNCLPACQYAPPHVFAVNVPRALAEARLASHAAHAWPLALGRLLARWPLRAPLLCVLATTLLMLLAVALTVPSAELLATGAEAGAFYRILPWEAMVALGGVPLAWSALAVLIGWRRFWRAGGGRLPLSWTVLSATLTAALSLHHRRGGGIGCAERGTRHAHWRRRWHQVLVGGFLLCLAATLSAAFAHHWLGQVAPYPLLSAPVLCGLSGGILMLLALFGLLGQLLVAGRQTGTAATRGGQLALLLVLFAVVGSGLALWYWRDSAAMGWLLAAHLGMVSGLWLLLPYGKFAHPGYRILAVLRDTGERSSEHRSLITDQ